MKSTKAAAMDTSTLTMESLALPRELYWDGKTEPISPCSTELFSITNIDDTEIWPYNDIIADELTTLLTDNDDDKLDLKQTVFISHELANGDDIVIELCDLKQEYLLDSKLPQYLNYPTGVELTHPHFATKVQTPIELTGFCAASFDTAVLAQLTPPQSPPQNSAAASPVYQHNIQFNEHHTSFNNVLDTSAALTTPAPSPIPTKIQTIIKNDTPATASFHWNVNVQQAVANNTNKTDENTGSSSSVQNASPNETAGGQMLSDDLELQMQLVDEIISTRAKELSSWSAIDECETQSSYSAPSQTDSCTLPTDDDTLAESCYSSSVASPHYQRNNNSSSSSSSSSSISGSGSENQQSGASLASLEYVASAVKPNASKKRTRPYGRGVEDRKIRKKEQNKNAATRYRQKKKLEMECILTEEQKLQKRNDELQENLGELKREEKYLKSLIREFFNKPKNPA